MSIHIYQIAYSEESKRLCDPGFEQLDNLSNERPDWREYWAIRKYLKSHELDEKSLYGFFSPKFKDKTGLSADQVFEFIRANEDGRDVILFSPGFDHIAFFKNAFEQGESLHPGFNELAARLFTHLGLENKSATMISCTRNTVYSNFFVARPSFWRQWFDVTEKIFNACENKESPLYGELNKVAEYHEADVPFKVFVIERIASYLLWNCDLRRVKAYFLPNSVTNSSWVKDFPGDLLVMDALKSAYLEYGNPLHLDMYQNIRDFIMSRYQTPLATH